MTPNDDGETVETMTETTTKQATRRVIPRDRMVTDDQLAELRARFVEQGETLAAISESQGIPYQRLKNYSFRYQWSNQREKYAKRVQENLAEFRQSDLKRRAWLFIDQVANRVELLLSWLTKLDTPIKVKDAREQVALLAEINKVGRSVFGLDDSKGSAYIINVTELHRRDEVIEIDTSDAA